MQDFSDRNVSSRVDSCKERMPHLIGKLGSLIKFFFVVFLWYFVCGEMISVIFLLKIECVGVLAVPKMFNFMDCAM